MNNSLFLFSRFCQILRSDQPNIGILMSGGGSNADVLLQKRHLYPNLNICSLITDQASSNALALAKKHGINCIVHEGLVNSQENRKNYFTSLTTILQRANISALLYAGFMKIATDEFVHTFPGINSHPADLRVLTISGTRKYVGMNAVQLAIDDDCPEFRCSCCLVEKTVDEGLLIACSNPILRSELPQSSLSSVLLHEEMKRSAEWLYYPAVIQKITAGNISENSTKPYIFTQKELAHAENN